MSERDPLRNQPVTPEEVEAAERLARALDGQDTADVDPEALQAAWLLQSLDAGEDEVASRRLRTALVAEVRGARRSAALARRGLLAAGVAAGVLLGVLWRHGSVRNRELLAEREREAGRAVATVSAGWSVDGAMATRLHAAFDEQWRARLATKVEGERTSALTNSIQSSASQERGAGTV